MPARFGPWQTAYDRLGRSRGGLTSKVHLACDGRGRPLSIVVTAGQRHERAQLVAVVDGIRVPRPGRGRPRKRPGHLVADRGYSYPAAAGCCGDGASRTPSQSGVTSGGDGRRAPAAPSGRTPPATVAGRWSNAA